MRRIHPGGARRVESSDLRTELLDLLRQRPDVSPSQALVVVDQIERVIRWYRGEAMLDGWRVYPHETVTPPEGRRRGKPIDNPRFLLDLATGQALNDAGIPVRNSASGTFAAVLRIVRGRCGLPAPHGRKAVDKVARVITRQVFGRDGHLYLFLR